MSKAGSCSRMCRAFLEALGIPLRDRTLFSSRGFSANRASIRVNATGVVLRCIGCDPARAHGIAPSMVLADEPAMWLPNSRDRMLAALMTSLGKQADSKLIALGTRPASSKDHWFSKQLDGGADYCQTHSARPADKPFNRCDVVPC